jgi:4-amino-4-deoxy-L-arabinose transferase-like glycosyltransferase
MDPAWVGDQLAGTGSRRRLRIVLAIAIIFVTSLGVRLLCWNDVRFEARKVQSGVTSNYKHLAHLLRENGAGSFFDPESTTSDPYLLGHPPGYPIFLAVVFSFFGEADAAIQIVQLFADSVAAVLIFLIAVKLFPFGCAAIAGAMAAISPQFSWNSALLLPDTLAVLPVLLAILLVVHASQPRAMLNMFAAGALIGVSCWLRANTLLFAPFLLLAIPLLFRKGLRISTGLSLLAGTFLVIAPLTIRNAIVFNHFIPVSLGAGQTLIEGIADYDEQKRFALPETDIELIQEEAAKTGNAEYAKSLFSPDGIERDRARLKRGFEVIRANPFWFAGVMAQRAGSMVRLERTPVTSTAPIAEGWLRFPRLAVRLVQKLFITALLLPLVAIGLVVLSRARQWRALCLLLIVPCYYFCVQSALHTEYRYVIAVDCFLFILAAIALYDITLTAKRSWASSRRQPIV